MLRRHDETFSLILEGSRRELRPFDGCRRRAIMFEKEEIAMESAVARRTAEALLAEHRAGAPFKSFLPRGASISDAYDVQHEYVALLRATQGDAIGYKVGLTSKAMQSFCGIDHPIAGVVLAKRLHRSGAALRRADFGRLGLEFEVAVRLKSDVPASAAPLTPAAIAPHIDGVGAAIEVVDDRSADYSNLDVRSLVADNSWNAGIVVSDFASKWPELKTVLGKAAANGAPVGEGRGCDILGHPFNSVAWLAAHLAARGEVLKAGQIVMTGSVMKTVFPAEDASYRFNFDGLGSVDAHVR
jgi:2-keto-4-pentenoate hydratase